MISLSFLIRQYFSGRRRIIANIGEGVMLFSAATEGPMQNSFPLRAGMGCSLCTVVLDFNLLRIRRGYN